MNNKEHMIEISESLATELLEKIEELMDRSNLSTYSVSIYFCEFCHATSIVHGKISDNAPIIHASYCLGMRALAALKGLSSNG